MRHLLPRVSEGVPAEGFLGRALQLRRRLHARARWEYLFCARRQERQSQGRAAVQLRLAGEFRCFVPTLNVRTSWFGSDVQTDQSSEMVFDF